MRGVRGGVERGIRGAVVGLPRRAEERRQRRKQNLRRYRVRVCCLHQRSQAVHLRRKHAPHA